MLTRLMNAFFLFLMIVMVFPGNAVANPSINIPILCYHNLNPTVRGSMNMSPEKFESQLAWLKNNGFTFISLKEAAEYLQGKRATLPAKPVVITVDDGWQSTYTYMLPLARKYNIPMTLFIYPETISSGKHAMTWNELKELKQTGLFDIQGHTYTHPNFKQERKTLSSAQYEKFVKMELAGSKKILEDKLNIKVTLLAWPFGIYDPYLEKQAANAGYEMAFTIDGEFSNRKDRPMAQPRFMIVDGLSMKSFEKTLETSFRGL